MKRRGAAAGPFDGGWLGRRGRTPGAGVDLVDVRRDLRRRGASPGTRVAGRRGRDWWKRGGTEVGTAIDQRLRLSFTTVAPVDEAALTGIEITGRTGAGLRMRAVGNQLAARLTETVHRLDLDNRDTPMDRAHDEEEDLARLLIAAAWYQIAYRNWTGFTYTPLFIKALEDPGAFTLQRLLQLPHRDMVTDVVAQLYKAADGPLNALRARTWPADCTGGPTFPGARITADADLVVDGLLIDFKSTKHPHTLRKNVAWQLLGYLLLDTADQYRIDTLGLYLSRSGVLTNWSVEEYLDLLGTRRRELAAFRAAFAELLAGCTADVVAHGSEEEDRVCRLLERLAPVIPPGHCLVCAQPLPDSMHRVYCSRWCSMRAPTLRQKGWLPPGPTVAQDGEGGAGPRGACRNQLSTITGGGKR
ncbi:hypothetical protein [Streptomyces sp. NPDC059909]|uniref:hypothetical protein n=1 Tax=Streptomyces sp. NPDC059909 TaxID=3346998 RepID=UPI00365A5B30